MTTVNDKKNKTWSLELTVGSARRVKNETGVNLLNMISLESDGKASTAELEKLIEDPFALVKVLFTLCEKQAEESGVSGEDYAELFDGDVITAATNALIEEIINFSPAAKRKALTKFYQTAQRIAAAQEKELEKILNDEKVDEKIEEEMKKSYTGSQASSASIQIPLHSGS